MIEESTPLWQENNEEKVSPGEEAVSGVEDLQDHQIATVKMTRANPITRLLDLSCLQTRQVKRIILLLTLSGSSFNTYQQRWENEVMI